MIYDVILAKSILSEGSYVVLRPTVSWTFLHIHTQVLKIRARNSRRDVNLQKKPAKGG